MQNDPGGPALYTLAANRSGSTGNDVPAYYSTAMNTRTGHGYEPAYYSAAVNTGDGAGAGAGAGDDPAYYNTASNTGSADDDSTSVYVLC